MLGEIIRKEILEHLISLRFAITCILCFVVVLCSLFVRTQDYGQALDEYSQNVAQTRAELKEIRRAWGFAWRGTTVYQAPNPLKVFVRGIEDRNGMSVHLVSREPVQFYGQFLPNAIVPLFPAMDVVTFVGIIMSLLAMVFGYDAVCGEKERGTLRLMLSYSVPRDVVLLGKWIGGYVALILPFLLTVVAGVVIVLIQPKVSLTPDEWLRFLGICGLALVYIAAVYSMAVWISCLTARPSTSIMILVTLWMVLVLTVPNLSPYLAQTLRPMPNPVQIENSRTAQTREIRIRDIDAPAEKANKELGFKTNEWWSEVDWNDPEDYKRICKRFLAEIQYMGVAHLNQMHASRKIDEDQERLLDNQVELSRWIARISPFSCLAMSATELSDAGLVSKRRFIRQVRDHQEVIHNYTVAESVAYETMYIEKGGPTVKGGPHKELPLWPEVRKPIPQFAYTPPAGSEYLRMVLLDAGILAAETFVFFLLSFTAFLRYDVR